MAAVISELQPSILDLPNCIFFFDLGLSIYFFLFNLFLLDKHYSEPILGALTSVMAAGSLAGAMPAGKLAQKFGLRAVLLSCFLFTVVVFSLRTILLAFVWQVCLAFLAGITLSAWAVCISPVVAQLTPEKQRPRAFSFVFSFGIGLGALGGLVGSRLPIWIARNYLSRLSLEPKQIVLLLSCCIVGVGLLPATRLRFASVTIPPRTKPILSRFLLRFLPAIAVWSLVTGSFSPLANVYFVQHLHMSVRQIGNAFSISQIVQVIAVLLAPTIFKRFGLITGIASTQLATSFMLLVLAAAAHPSAATAAYVGFTAFQWMNEPGLYSLLMNMVPEKMQSGASASNNLVMSATQSVAAALAGSAFAHYGYAASLRGIAIVAAVAAGLFWSFRTQSPVQSDTIG